jgi:hypothetical protein
MEEINERISNEICYETLNELTDVKLMCEYTKCKSVKNNIKELENILEKHTDKETSEKILQEYSLKLIPAGTKVL